jgi:hypothetical protein
MDGQSSMQECFLADQYCVAGMKYYLLGRDNSLTLIKDFDLLGDAFEMGWAYTLPIG